MAPPTKQQYQDPSGTPPKQTSLAYLPASWIPYAELIRLNKPAGALYLYMPCLSSTVLAACLRTPPPPPSQLLKTNALFLLGSFIFRSAACTWNDILDQDIDRRVSRTRLRPLARRAISTRHALLYNAVQAALGTALLCSAFPRPCVGYSLPSIVLIALYPLAKRVTYYPQVVLGLTWSWGAVIGFPAMGVALGGGDARAFWVASCLYGSGFAWTILYDTVYAHQDLQDDKKAGVKSIAIVFERDARAMLSVLAVVKIAFLVMAGIVMEAGGFYILGCGFAAGAMGVMVATVDLKSPESCWFWFRNGSWLVGGGVAAGVCGEYGFRRLCMM